MEENIKNDMGIVKISDEVVGVIAGLAASEVEGIVGMSSGVVGGITQILKGKKNLSKGVKVNATEDSVSIDLYVVVEYGIKILDVALKVQEDVRRSIETMTGLTVSAVNIHVQNVMIPKMDKEPEEFIDLEQ
ncbi:Asp23/Gls24 family envelope stress response protein [Clostridium niameyense]|uniref:Asp23/Gls24 family envelope stress response protein n=1 Tax=Clostridium niameyense TaxID=1622073 RepID=A0A6M0R7W5_9CLOT|nr:Asp23/Gls24 family envelope stress response protein [Clostridium niameyense]NEZ46305.1 Asp23/Gls24 family envelope stress response protein [Clostridium niameyense]